MTPNTRALFSIRGTAVHGVTVLFAASLVAKLAAIATLYVTGALLSQSDFALYAIAIAWGEVFGFLQNGGLHRLLLQRARSFDKLYAPVLGLALGLNVIWFLILLVLAPVIADAYNAQGVTLLIVLFGLSIPAGTMALLLRVRLKINLRFAELSALDVYSALIRNSGVILLALAGFGPVSFVLPVIAVGVFESIYLSRGRPVSWRPSLPRRRLFRALVKPCLWIMASMLAASLVANGDYLVIAVMQDKATVGLYFFGFQLTVAVVSMFALSLRSVFVPSFVALGTDLRRQEEAFLRSLEMGSLLLFFILFSVVAIAEPAVAWIWSGKWNAAVPVIEIIAVASLARVVSPIARSLLEARGAWRTIALMMWIEGLGLMASAAIGAFLGGLLAIAVSVGVYMTMFGVLYIVVISRQMACSTATVAKSVLGPYALAAGALAGSWTLATVFQPFFDPLPEILIKGAGFAVVFTLLMVLLKRDSMRMIVEILRQRFAR